LRAVTIANTDRGGAGHGLHRAWQANPDVRMVALADPVDEGREELAVACGAERTYADYREMLERERPDIVAIARHWYDDGRVAETLAAIEAGARGLYVEKPLAPWADQARAVMDAAEAAGTHVVLAHRSREHPGMQAIRARGEAGEWGPMTRIRAMDKGDHRVGVEESMIHAPHVFDAMLYLVGEAPVQVSGLVLQDGRPATRADAETALGAFIAEFEAKYPKAAACLAEDREALLAFFDFPAEHWLHLRTSNVIESVFATVRLRQRVTKGAGSRTKGLLMAYKLVAMAQRRWRRLNGAHLLPLVRAGVVFVDGVIQTEREDRKEAA